MHCQQDFLSVSCQVCITACCVCFMPTSAIRIRSLSMIDHAYFTGSWLYDGISHAALPTAGQSNSRQKALTVSLMGKELTCAR